MYVRYGMPLVVVNGGAGGDQMPDGYGDRLFHAMTTVAARFDADSTPAHFVFVTGPYYAGRSLAERANVTVRRFEPNLHALLSIADVAVIKPGNNVLSEALSGTSQLILVPDASFMEGLDEHSQRIVADYSGTVARPDADELEPLVRKALSAGRRERRLTALPSAGVRAVVSTVHQLADDEQLSVEMPRLCLVTDSDGATLPASAPTTSSIVAMPGAARRFRYHIRSVLDRHPVACVRLDMSWLLRDERDHYENEVKDWLAHQPVRLIPVDEYCEIVARDLLEKR
jgi:hypothetical protein